MKPDKNVFNWVRGHESALLHHFDTVSRPPLLRFLFKNIQSKDIRTFNNWHSSNSETRT